MIGPNDLPYSGAELARRLTYAAAILTLMQMGLPRAAEGVVGLASRIEKRLAPKRHADPQSATWRRTVW